MKNPTKKSGLAKGWTTDDVVELNEIVAELTDIRQREAILHDRFAKLQWKV